MLLYNYFGLSVKFMDYTETKVIADSYELVQRSFNARADPHDICLVCILTVLYFVFFTNYDNLLSLHVSCLGPGLTPPTSPCRSRTHRT